MKYALLLMANILALAASSQGAEVRVALYYDHGVPAIHLAGIPLRAYRADIGKQDAEPTQTIPLDETPAAVFDLEPGNYRITFDEPGFLYREIRVAVHSRPQQVRMRVRVANMAHFTTPEVRDGRYYWDGQLVRRLGDGCLLDGTVIKTGDSSRLWLRAEPFLRTKDSGSDQSLVDNTAISPDGQFSFENYMDCGLYLFSVFQDSMEPDAPPSLIHSELRSVGEDPIVLTIAE